MKRGERMTDEQRARISERVRETIAARKRDEPHEPGRRVDPPPRVPPDAGTSQAKRKPPADHKTKPRGKSKATDAELARALGKLLVFPAVPSKMLLGCDYCTEHFITEGPKAARELVELSKEHPELRGVLEDIHRNLTRITWAGIILGYLAKPLAHHLVPDPMLEFAYPILEVPPRHPATNGATTTDAPPPPPGVPPGLWEQAQKAASNLTEDEAAALARQFGLGAMMEPDATTAEDHPATPPPADSPAEGDAEGAAAADADPLAGIE